MIGLCGAPSAIGVTAFEACEGRPVPTALVARTLMVYVAPSINPPTVIGLEGPVALAPPGDASALYEEIGPPLVGGLNVTVAWPSPAVAVPITGAGGGPGSCETLVMIVSVPTATQVPMLPTQLTPTSPFAETAADAANGGCDPPDWGRSLDTMDPPSPSATQACGFGQLMALRGLVPVDGAGTQPPPAPWLPGVSEYSSIDPVTPPTSPAAKQSVDVPSDVQLTPLSVEVGLPMGSTCHVAPPSAVPMAIPVSCPFPTA